MLLVDYKCSDCGHIWEVDKGSGLNDDPKLKCPECGSKDTFKKFGIGAVDTAEGIFGNGRTGMSKNVTYHPSSLTSKVKGTKIRSIK